MTGRRTGVICMHVHIPKMGYFSAMMKNAILSFIETDQTEELEDLMLRARHRKEPHRLSHMWKLKNKSQPEFRMVITRG
jgi:hypothetical protein